MKDKQFQNLVDSMAHFLEACGHRDATRQRWYAELARDMARAAALIYDTRTDEEVFSRKPQ